jgi:hypothetical protein
MTELVPLSTLSGTELRAALRRQLPALGLRDGWCVERILGADAPIDLVGAEPGGRATVVLVAPPGAELATLASALAQRAFVAARLDDWKQLAPGLPLSPGAGVRTVVLGTEFCVQAQAAAAGAGEVELWRLRALRNGAGTELVLEPVGGSAGARDPRPPGPDDAPRESVFRTGLGDAELGLSPDELREFE